MSAPKPSPILPTTPRKHAALSLMLVLTVAFLALGFFSPARTNPRLAWTFAGVAAFLLCWQGALLLGQRRKGLRFEWEFVPVRSHYIQALVQSSIYVYWGWYWRNVYAEIPLILAQVAFLYMFDALVTWSRGRTWRAGFGPWPIVLSTNLFMWFRDDWFVFQFLMVALGVLGKQFVRWPRAGRETHIFNPSAFALTLVSLVLLATSATGDTWGVEIALTQGRPPHLFLEIFCCGLVVQYFFSVTLLTFSAAAAIGLLDLVYFHTTGVYFFGTTNLPVAVFLGLHLLMTDPATTPRSSLGRIAFGGLYGVGVCVAFWVLEALGLPSFYDKLVVVPFLNLLAPLLDHIAAWAGLREFGRWESRIGPRTANLGYMTCWLALFLVMLTTGFVEAPHPGATIAFWARAAEQKRPNATKYLTHLLDELDRQNLNDASIAVARLGASGPENRRETLGILCNEVGTIYAQGKLVPSQPAKAIHYFQEACAFGNTEGCANLLTQYFHAKPDDPQVGTELALSTLENPGVAERSGPICYLLAFSYDKGHGRPVDKTKARQYYEKGAALGEKRAWKNLARMQLAGEGGPRDHTAAAGWLQKAADAQDGQSCLDLARMYFSGDSVPKDKSKAVALLEKACALGIQPACELLTGLRK